MTIHLPGRVAIVTGSSSGNGRGIALRLAQDGATVVCADLQPHPVDNGYEGDATVDTCDLIRRAGGRADFIATDVADTEAVRALISSTVERHGRLDVLVNNAGVFTGLHTLVDETEEQFDRTMRVNVKGVWAGCKYAIRQMLTQEPLGGSRGRIVNIASIGGLKGLPAEPAYCASKGAIVNFTRQIALDFAPHRINANVLCPGAVMTAMLRPLVEHPDLEPLVRASTPWPRYGTPQDIAAAVAWLASDDAEWMTGSVVSLDGGVSSH
ncbi:SDR family NAD(P)-dependent oxidoreductase [Aquabacterium sp. J223]|uniref:SDR family NAD(P)-dependent oxidoreductase n=1 Tax=Aquabacterium sp. J223 TaxID=2898431 RepID=UPI0021AD6882|nr:SDR family oxidoreductase [Aquabacterium sp. J223]UUX94046.1 SDR family oxidoreductase [Aquabacterium sp. J223]